MAGGKLNPSTQTCRRGQWGCRDWGLCWRNEHCAGLCVLQVILPSTVLTLVVAISPWAGGVTSVWCLPSRGWFPEAEGGNRPLRADLAFWSLKWDDVRGYWSPVVNLVWPIEHAALEGCNRRILQIDSFLFCSCWQNELDRNISNLEYVDWLLIGHQSWLYFTFISD